MAGRLDKQAVFVFFSFKYSVLSVGSMSISGVMISIYYCNKPPDTGSTDDDIFCTD